MTEETRDQDDPAAARGPAHTRRRIRRLLKHGGPQRADDLAGALGLTAMAVRQHLYAMAEAGEVEGTAVPQARGRPAKRWALTSRADAFFEDGHADLAVGLIESLRRTLGDAAMERLLADRTAQQIAVYRARVGRHDSLESRVRALAAIRGEEGYMAAVESDPEGAPDSWLLVENHCPICHAARACTGLCAQELTVFREVLGEAVAIDRTEHLLDGARRCAYRIRARG